MTLQAAPPSEDVRSEVASVRQRVQTAIAQVVVGMEDVVDQLLIALFTGGHVLIEGVPGTAKTTLAKTFAHVLGLEFHRVQFTPDLLPSDITGTYVFDRKTNDFVLRKGPLFCQLLLADEVNRAPAKTQSALLEAMQEQQATIEGTTLVLPRPFLVLATQNPVEHEGVYRLPEAQLDRFLMRVIMGYPSEQTEIEILQLHSGQDRSDSGSLEGPSMPSAVLGADDVIRMQQLVARVYTEPRLMQYIVQLSRASRLHDDLTLGASPRASLCLLQAARARALIRGRHYCTHEDVHDVVISVWGHRLILKPEAEVDGRSITEVVGQLLRQIPILDGVPPKPGMPPKTASY